MAKKYGPTKAEVALSAIADRRRPAEEEEEEIRRWA
jgi:hypothetical protein